MSGSGNGSEADGERLDNSRPVLDSTSGPHVLLLLHLLWDREDLSAHGECTYLPTNQSGLPIG